MRGLVCGADMVSDVFGQILLISWCQIPAGADRGGKIAKMIKQSCSCPLHGEKPVLTSGLKYDQCSKAVWAETLLGLS